MKLLALRLCEHDTNFSYFDGETLHYYKSERDYQIKHHSFENLWEWRDVVGRIWNLDYKDLDEIAIVIDPWHNNLPTNNEDFFPAIEYDLFPAPCKVYRINHHYAHSLSTWMMVKEKEADLHVVIDGFGDYDRAWSVIKNHQLVETGSVIKNGSLGLELASAAEYLNITSSHKLDLAGKAMGLQSYGKIDEGFLQFLSKFDLYSIKNIFNTHHWFNYKNDPLIANLQPLDWIRTVHEHVGNVLVNFFKKHAKEDDIITFTGGVAQNVIWNTKLKKHFKNLIIPPHCADDGLSLGGIEWLRIKNNLPHFDLKNFPYCQDDENTESVSLETIEEVAKLLSHGKTVAWYQGNGELGARALGNRSIFFDPRFPAGKTVINKIKNREQYRPFGAVVLDEFKSEYFDIDFDNPHMLYVANVKSQLLPTITHVDGTCRIQTVKEENWSLRTLLEKFYYLTKCPVLLNTSLNLAGKPIAGKKSDAIEFFKTTPIDCLVIGNEIVCK